MLWSRIRQEYNHILFLVLILVLVDYALERSRWGRYCTFRRVLILVLVDYALERLSYSFNNIFQSGFNPCFSGLCFGADIQDDLPEGLQQSFNPCFSGLCFGASICALA